MEADDQVFVAGAFEHPTREAESKSTLELHGEVARGALEDAGLSKDQVDGYLTAGVPEGGFSLQPLVMADYLGLDVAYADSTDIGGSAYIDHVGHAVSAVRDGKCDVALVTFAARPLSSGRSSGRFLTMPDHFEAQYGLTTLNMYGMAAQRHMHEYGTTNEQLAAIREAASHHAQYNPNAKYQDPVSIEDVLDSPVVADPLHILDCCVVTDGAGALVLVSQSVRDRLDRECVEVLGHGLSIKHHEAGDIDLTYTAGRKSGRRAYEEAGIGPEDVDYVSIYDSFTITVLETLEDLGFCEKGAGGAFVEGGTLKAPNGDLPFNTDGGGLCSNHPSRGGMLKLIETVRQLRREAHEAVQVPDAQIGLAHGTGGSIGTRHGSSTVVLGREGR